MVKAFFTNSTAKILLILVLLLLFLIPIGLVQDLIYDRKSYQEEAVSSIVMPLGGEMKFQGVVIALPYKSSSQMLDKDGNKYITTKTKYILFAPNLYNLDISVDPYYLTRGIFKVPVFNGKIALKSQFNSLDYSHFEILHKDIMPKGAILILGLGNTKNLTSEPKINLNGKDLSISEIKFDNISPFSNSIFYNIENIDISKELSLSATIDFQGGKNIKIYPIASNNIINMSSSWKVPSFSGDWLPTQRKFSQNGFEATWNILGLSTSYPKSWLSQNDILEAKERVAVATIDSNKFNAPQWLNVSLMVPVDSYKKTHRCVKYALLFLIVPFISLLILEIFSKTKIHPIQYCLIGFADVIFYLLLLSVSEHISFDLSYLICSLSVCLTTFLYAYAIFKNIKWGAMLSSIQLISYIFLYGTLQAEDYALLIGSIGMFVVVAFLMYITRKIDWYELNK